MGPTVGHTHVALGGTQRWAGRPGLSSPPLAPSRSLAPLRGLLRQARPTLTALIFCDPPGSSQGAVVPSDRRTS